MMNYILMMQSQDGQKSGMMSSMLMMLLIIVVFYFFMIRPQVKRQKEMKTFRDSLAKGDKVVTTGGIYGKIIEVKDNAVILEIAKDIEIKVDKSAVIKDMSDAPQPK